MELLERDIYLKELKKLFEDLSKNSGLMVFVSGEAGIGKTSLVENFIKNIGDRANILWGACDDLFTPRPLGPLYDIASQLKNGLLNLLNNNAPRTIIFSKFLQDIQENNKLNIVILEDVHWADESTLDLIKFLGRRANRLNSLFIITYRDDEIGPEHPLRMIFGDIPSKNLIKFKLSALSEKTVGELADTFKFNDLYKITLGNPFLITELLSAREEGIPSKVHDAILTRMSRLSFKAKALADLVSVIPTRAEKWLIDGIIPDNSGLLEECFNIGILSMDRRTVFFKHELSRMAAEEALSESRRKFFNEKVLEILLNQKKIEIYLARIIHHALKIPAVDVLIEFSPLAAKQASSLGAHRLAADHYRNVLNYADLISIEKLLELYGGRADECYLTCQIGEGIKACESLLELLKVHPDPYIEGENYRRLSRLMWHAGEDYKSEEYLLQALEILEKLEPGKQLAMTYGNLSQTYMIRDKSCSTFMWGKKAIDLARKVNDLETEAHALITIGCRKMCDNDDSGKKDLMEGLDISLKNDFHEQAARTYSDLGSVYLWRRNLLEAEKYLSMGIEYCIDKDIDTIGSYITGDYARTKLFSGNWDEAVEYATKGLHMKNIPVIARIVPLYVLGIIRTRRGDPGAAGILNEAKSLILNMGENWEMTVTVKSALAELFWLQNNLENFMDELKDDYIKIKKSCNWWAVGEIAYWLWKGGQLIELPGRIAEPYQFQIKGEWETAAHLWKELNCPYKQAMALCEGDSSAMKKAVEIFDRLGANAVSQKIKQKMREQGVKNIPKGPRKTTRVNPAGLTSRQMEVLKLLGNGLSNNEIGNRLFISPKTVDHHISAILSKLNIHSRHEAAAFVSSEEKNKIYIG